MTRSTAGDPAGAPGSEEPGPLRPDLLTGVSSARVSSAGSQPPVFFADAEDLASDLIVLAGSEGRHAADVRRLAVG